MFFLWKTTKLFLTTGTFGKKKCIKKIHKVKRKKCLNTGLLCLKRMLEKESCFSWNLLLAPSGEWGPSRCFPLHRHFRHHHLRRFLLPLPLLLLRCPPPRPQRGQNWMKKTRAIILFIKIFSFLFCTQKCWCPRIGPGPQAGQTPGCRPKKAKSA